MGVTVRWTVIIVLILLVISYFKWSDISGYLNLAGFDSSKAYVIDVIPYMTYFELHKRDISRWRSIAENILARELMMSIVDVYNRGDNHMTVRDFASAGSAFKNAKRNDYFNHVASLGTVDGPAYIVNALKVLTHANKATPAEIEAANWQSNN